jgi:hypothetical protein
MGILSLLVMGSLASAQSLESFHFVSAKELRANLAASQPRPGVYDLIDTLKNPAIPFDRKAAALDALKFEDFRELDSYLGNFSSEDEMQLAHSLSWITDAGSYQVATRVRALRVWGALGRWFKYSAAITQTVDKMAELASLRNTHDSRQALATSALLALSAVAERLPQFETQAQEKVLGVAFDTNRMSYEPGEREAGMRILFNYLHGHGLGVLETSPTARMRFRSEFVDPLKANPTALYSDSRNREAYRGYLYRSLHLVAHTRYPGTDERIRFDCDQILKRLHESRYETDPNLRQILALYATGRLPL